MTIQIVKKLLKCYKDIFREINEPLKHLFHLSQEDGIFLEKAGIAKATQLFKNRNPENIKNYHPISVRPCFSIVFEHVMYNRL